METHFEFTCIQFTRVIIKRVSRIQEKKKKRSFGELTSTISSEKSVNAALLVDFRNVVILQLATPPPATKKIL